MRTLYGSLPLALWAMLSGAGASADVRLADPKPTRGAPPLGGQVRVGEAKRCGASDHEG